MHQSSGSSGLSVHQKTRSSKLGNVRKLCYSGKSRPCEELRWLKCVHLTYAWLEAWRALIAKFKIFVEASGLQPTCVRCAAEIISLCNSARCLLTYVHDLLEGSLFLCLSVNRYLGFRLFVYTSSTKELECSIFGSCLLLP